MNSYAFLNLVWTLKLKLPQTSTHYPKFGRTHMHARTHTHTHAQAHIYTHTDIAALSSEIIFTCSADTILMLVY